MAIVQHNPEVPNLDVTIDSDNPAVLRVAERQLPTGGVVKASAFDLTPYQGRPFRLYAQEDGTLVAALEGVHYWLVAEAVLPERRFETLDTGETDAHGEPVVQHIEAPLDLNDVDVVVYPWPSEDEQEVE